MAQLLDQLPYLLGALTVSGEYGRRAGTRIIGLVGLGGAFGERDAIDTRGGRVVTEEDQREKNDLVKWRIDHQFYGPSQLQRGLLHGIR